MQLHPDARWILTKAWSVRLIVAAAILSGAEVVFNVLSAYAVPTPLPNGVLAALAGLVSVAAFVARFVAQKKTGAE